MDGTSSCQGAEGEGKEDATPAATPDDKKALNKSSSFFGSLFGSRKFDQKPSGMEEDMEQGDVPPEDKPSDDENDDDGDAEDNDGEN